MVKRSHQKVNKNQEWDPREQKEVSVEAVHVISTEKDEEQVTSMTFKLFDPNLPMNELPQCLFANVVADISGPNADPNSIRERNFEKGMIDHLEMAYKPSPGETKRHKCFATVEVKTIRNLDMRLAECDNKSPKGNVAGCGGQPGRQTQTDHPM